MVFLLAGQDFRPNTAKNQIGKGPELFNLFTFTVQWVMVYF